MDIDAYFEYVEQQYYEWLESPEGQRIDAWNKFMDFEPGGFYDEYYSDPLPF